MSYREPVTITESTFTPKAPEGELKIPIEAIEEWANAPGATFNERLFSRAVLATVLSWKRRAEDRLRQIENTRNRARPGDPPYKTIAGQLAAAYERLALESHRADELHRALNQLVIGLRVGLTVKTGAEALDEAEEALELSSKQRPAVAVECRRCGAQHGFDDWVKLKALGLQEQGDLLGEPLELRNCECGSTLAMPLRRLPL